MKINREQNQIEVEVNSHWRTFKFVDIKSITKIITARAGRRKNQKLRWGDFYFFILELKNKEEIIITSLMTDKESIDINGIENHIEAHGNGWFPLEGRKIVNFQEF